MKVRFEHLVLKNWRNFREVDVGLEERAFIVGPNASGKTNLIDALRFLHDIAEPGGGLVQALARRGGIGHLRSLHARPGKGNVRVEVSVEIDGTNWSYALELAGTKTLEIVEERAVRNRKTLLRRPEARDRIDPKLLEQTHLEQLGMNERFRDLAKALASVRHVHVVPQITRAAMRAQYVSRGDDLAGSDFIDRLAALPRAEQVEALSRIKVLLKKAVPQFSGLRIQRDDQGTPHLQAKYRHWRSKESWQDETDFSDGTLRFVGLMWALSDGKGPLLAEEPELSLHPGVVRQFPLVIARASMFSARQVIVTTNSEEIFTDPGIDPSEVLILEPTAEGTQVHRASDYEHISNAAAAGVPLGPLVTARTRPEGIEQLASVIPEGRP